MPIPEINGTSSLDPGPDGAIGREDAEAKEPGIGADGEHGRNRAGQEEDVQSGEAEEEEEEDKAIAATAPPTSATAANAKTLFGMKRSNPTVKKGLKATSNPIPFVSHQFLGNDSYDYEQKYPEDAPNEEAASAARVWRTYEDESRNHDANMVEESRDNVDVLLVFVSLAVVLLYFITEPCRRRVSSQRL